MKYSEQELNSEGATKFICPSQKNINFFVCSVYLYISISMSKNVNENVGDVDNLKKYLNENNELKLRIVDLQEMLDKIQGENLNVNNEIHHVRLIFLKEYYFFFTNSCCLIRVFLLLQVLIVGFGQKKRVFFLWPKTTVSSCKTNHH
jgi:hypothetical protein